MNKMDTPLEKEFGEDFSVVVSEYDFSLDKTTMNVIETIEEAADL